LDQSDMRAFIFAAQRLASVSDISQYRKLTIHLYRSGETMGGIIGMLDFSRERVCSLIERGYQDTMYHDCKQNQCIIPE
ncbi:MAG: hypothetical protein LC802_00920, partial [Acidobacteria bacterium]|nr:hypothetical protein [Acidobacteriota bacterium]